MTVTIINSKAVDEETHEVRDRYRVVREEVPEDRIADFEDSPACSAFGGATIVNGKPAMYGAMNIIVGIIKKNLREDGDSITIVRRNTDKILREVSSRDFQV